MNSEIQEIQIDFLQPWSTFVMKTTLPLPILDKMIEITDRIYDNRDKQKKTESWNQPSISHGNKLAGEIENEFTITPRRPTAGTLTPTISADKNLMGFFEEVIKIFIGQSFRQNDVSAPLNDEEKEKRANKDNWIVDIQSMWSVHQKDNEYNPIHVHQACDISGVMYLKIPEYLPSRKSQLKPNKLGGESSAIDYDGTINFTTPTSSTSFNWGQSEMTISPKVGDIFIFPALQKHLVYPFRTVDGKGERRSVSFNSRFISIEEYEKFQKEGKNEKL